LFLSIVSKERGVSTYSIIKSLIFSGRSKSKNPKVSILYGLLGIKYTHLILSPSTIWVCFLSKPLNFSKSLYLTAALTPTGALFSNVLNILPAGGELAIYFDIPFTPVGLDISINDLSLSDSLKSNISLSIVSLVAPNSILFNISSKNSLNIYVYLKRMQNVLYILFSFLIYVYL